MNQIKDLSQNNKEFVFNQLGSMKNDSFQACSSDVELKKKLTDNFTNLILQNKNKLFLNEKERDLIQHNQGNNIFFKHIFRKKILRVFKVWILE